MRILLKRGLESNRSGTAVAEGEILFSKDTGRLFIGSGSGNFGGNEIRFNQLTSSFILATDVTASAGIMVQTSESLARFTLVSAGSIANADAIFSSKVSSGTPDSPSATLNGHYTAWQMQSFGGSTYSTSARMLMQTQGDHNEGSRPTNIIFSTVPSGSTTLQDRLKINGTGVQVTGSLGVTQDVNVVGSLTSSNLMVLASASFGAGLCVGSFTPYTGVSGVPLEVVTNSNRAAIFRNMNTASSGVGARIDFLQGTGAPSTASSIGSLRFITTGTGSVGYVGEFDLTLSTGGGSSFTALFISGSGNVAIGGATPKSKLDVSGSINSLGLTVTGSVDVTGPVSSATGTHFGAIDSTPIGLYTPDVGNFTTLTSNSGLTVTGSSIVSKGQGWGVTSTATAAGTTTLDATSTLIQIFTGTTTQTAQLPAANLYGVGVAVVFIFKNRSTGIVTLQRAGADLIDGSTTAALSTTTSITLVSDGVSDWQII